MNSTEAMPIWNITSTNGPGTSQPMPCGPTAMPSATSSTTTGRRTPIGSSAISGAAAAAIITTRTGWSLRINALSAAAPHGLPGPRRPRRAGYAWAPAKPLHGAATTV
ncbi:MAG: hypothetical protein J0L57_08735 [Burkholderiales bacterium]|nr:hypothetical protein [Burkholderiales bacterium]